MSDEYVEVTRQGWLSRLGGAIGGTVVGVGFFIGAFPLLWWNEGRAVHTYQSLQEGAGAVVSVPAARVDPANEGKLVHLSGRATTDEVLTDPTFQISASGLRLRREVEMYQWVESKRTEKRQNLGGSEETITLYMYETAWKGGLVRSSSFRKPEGHRNPESMKYESVSWDAAAVTLGAFTLDLGLRRQIHGSEPVPATADTARLMNVPAGPIALVQPRSRKGKRAPLQHVPPLPYDRRGPWKLFGERLTNAADPEAPVVGDLRVSFSRVPPSEVSVVAQQRGSTFQPYRTSVGRSLEMLSAGDVTAAQMFAEAERDNTIITWLLRAGGFLLMLLGAYSVMRPMAVLASVLPFAGSLVSFGLGLISFAVAAPLSLVTIAVAWIFYRPLLAVAILVFAAGLMVALVTLLRRRKAARTAVPAFARSA